MGGASVPPAANRRWQVCVDTGGTFTDCIAVDPAGRVHRTKVLSSGRLRATVLRTIDNRTLEIKDLPQLPARYITGSTVLSGDSDTPNTIAECSSDHTRLVLRQPLHGEADSGTQIEIQIAAPAAVTALRLLAAEAGEQDIPESAMRLATTRGTNALLERKTPPVALFCTRGFGDLLEIGNQQRPDIFTLQIVKRRLLQYSVIEVDERIAADGSVVLPINLQSATAHARSLKQRDVQVAAIALMHSYRNPDHEAQLSAALRELGFVVVCCSSEISPTIRILDRTETAVVNAAITPVIEAYIRDIEQAVSATSIHMMTSAGGLVRADRYLAKDSLLSGPAAGVAGAAAAGQACGCEKIIGFDMGGTSTDVSRFDGDFEYTFRHEVGEARLAGPALAIETVAAGGGSICRFEDGALTVGPESAGADPGPACYGRGGPLTLTDINLLAGRIDVQRFSVPLHRDRADAAFQQLRQSLREVDDTRAEQPDVLLAQLLAIADQRMAAGIRRVSLRKGYDPADYALVSFGGAGGQHACALAEELGIDTIIMPADASVLSAVGLSRAVIEQFAEQQILATLHELQGQLEATVAKLEDQARNALCKEGVAEDECIVRRRIANMRLLGQESTLNIDFESSDALQQLFIDSYKAHYGYPPPNKPVEVESLRVVASSAPPPVSETDDSDASAAFAQSPGEPTRHQRMLCSDGWQDVPVYAYSDLALQQRICGPALISAPGSALVALPGWEGELHSSRAVIMRRRELQQQQQGRESERASQPADASKQVTQYELLAHRLTTIADDMGQMLERVALSTNVKERLDFSCAVLDPRGRLIVNAPHIPVHLGSLGMCVRSVAEQLDLKPGDVAATNHPAFGGSHLPDITVITPVFDQDHHLLGYVANRAHHAEIGGSRPGSMPPQATRLIEEGVVIAPMLLVREGVDQTSQLEQILQSGPYPSRAVSDNLADISAQIAANHHGARILRTTAAAIGRDLLISSMQQIEHQAASIMATVIQSLPRSHYSATETMDDGSPVQVTITRDNSRLHIDFTGSAPVHPGNLNATPAIVHAAVMYVLRLLCGRDMPLNEGVMDPVEVSLPAGMLNPDFSLPADQLPAVVGGNVETSQRIVDTLLQALQLQADSQGTMNNLLLGNDSFGYYETICGGSGAGDGYDGVDAVHTHMTNTRITDPEVLEHRYPVRLQRFAIRRGSGGRGVYNGGAGVIRELLFHEPLSLSLLTQRRHTSPRGLHGGGDGASGRQWIERFDGETFSLDAIDQADIQRGDRLIIETPGGGGWGHPDRQEEP